MSVYVKPYHDILEMKQPKNCCAKAWARQRRVIGVWSMIIALWSRFVLPKNKKKKICHCHYCHMRSMYWIMTTMLGFWGHWCNYALFALSALDVVLDAHKRHLVIYSYVVLTMTNNELIWMTQKNNKFSTTMDHNGSHHGHLTAYLKMLMEANVDTCI